MRPKLNPVFTRYKFNNEVQGKHSIEQFITKLKLLAKDCAFGDYENDMVRDRIVFGVTSVKIREKLINEGDKLTLDKAIQIAQSYEYAQEQLKTMAAPTEVHYISNTTQKTSPIKGTHTNPKPQGKSGRKQRNRGARGMDKPGQQKYASDKCGNCGYKHTKTETCKAKGKQCNFCHKWNHFEIVCRSKKSVHEVSERNYDSQVQNSDSDDFFVDSVESNKLVNDQAFVEIEVGPSSLPINFKIDTGSQVNILPYQTYTKLNLHHTLQKPSTKLTAYGGNTLNTLGCVTLTCKRTDRKKDLSFYIVETCSSPILGLRSSIDLELIKLVLSCETQASQLLETKHLTKATVLTQYAKAFQGIGLFPGECTIHLDPSISPVVNPPRRIPVALRDKVKQELDRMLKLNIIARVTEPTEWVNSMVAVESKHTGKLRVCLDPQHLNKAILRPHYPMRTLEDILPRLSGAKYFTKLDARSGYWAIKLSNQSSFLTTFNTPFGRYRYLRLAFGLKSSQDEFQRKIDECLEGLSGVVAIVDDTLVYGRTREEHDQNLCNVIKRSLEKGIRFNEDKLVVGVQQVEYFGHILTAQGVKASPNKVSAVRNMDPPTNRSELETFLGMINYLSKFCPNLAELTSPLRRLLAKDVEFAWDKPQADAFQKVKDVITQTPGPVLAYYDPKKPLTLQCDASKAGLGATIMQDGKPIAYASKSLTPTETLYAQIEKELYACLFGCKRFEQYIYGRKVHVETDHLPIVSIMKKPLHAAPPRLQRMLLQLQRYDIDVQYASGKKIPVADTLSRRYVSDTYPELSEGMDLHVHTVLSSLPISDRKMKEIKAHTEQDPQMDQLKQVILKGWPEERHLCPEQVLDYWNFRDELTVVDSLMLKGQKIVIPSALRPKMLEILHQGHFGCEKTLRRARDVMFWPKISSEMVLNCPICLERRSSNPKEPLIPHKVPDYPWQNIASDIFTWDDKNFLITVDYYSKYFEVQKLPSMKTSTIIAKLKTTFARNGIPMNFLSDNAPQFCSEEFTEFAKDWDFSLIKMSPKHSQSNGMVEKMVGICKRIFAKAKSAEKDPYLGILEYRTTPIKLGFSPSELLMGRKLRSVLPVTVDQLLPKTPPTEQIKENIHCAKQQQKKYYDQGSKTQTSLSIGDTARIQHDKTWKPAVVMEKHNDRSYSVKTPDGAVYRRNRRHLLKSKETIPNYQANSECTPDHSLSYQPSFENAEKGKSLQEPQICKSSSFTRNNNADLVIPPGKNDMTPYITRFGRTVKPKIIESM